MGSPNPRSWKRNKPEYPEVNAAKARISSQLVGATSDAKKAESARSKAQANIDAQPFSDRDTYNKLAKEVFSSRETANKTKARKKALEKLAGK